MLNLRVLRNNMIPKPFLLRHLHILTHSHCIDTRALVSYQKVKSVPSVQSPSNPTRQIGLRVTQYRRYLPEPGSALLSHESTVSYHTRR